VDADGGVKLEESTLSESYGEFVKITRGKKSIVLQIDLLGKPTTYEVALELLSSQDIEKLGDKVVKKIGKIT